MRAGSAGAGRAGVAVHPLDAVRGAEAAEPVPLDDAREAAALAGPGHIDPGDFLEELDGQGLALGDLGRRLLADLADIALGLGVDFLRMAAGGLRGVLPLPVVITELPGMIAVAILGPDLKHGAWAAFQDGDRLDGAIFLVDLGHADLAAE